MTRHRDTAAREHGQRLVSVIRGLLGDGLVTAQQLAIAAGGRSPAPVYKIVNHGREPLAGWFVAVARGIESVEGRGRLRALLGCEPAGGFQCGDAGDAGGAADDLSALMREASDLLCELAPIERRLNERGSLGVVSREDAARCEALVSRIRAVRSRIDRVGVRVDQWVERACRRQAAKPLGLAQ